MAAVAFCAVVGSGFRLLAYLRMAKNRVTSRLVWILIAAGEGAYAALILWLTWGATEPVVDAGFGWLGIALISGIAAFLSLGLFAAAATIRPEREQSLNPMESRG